MIAAHTFVLFSSLAAAGAPARLADRQVPLDPGHIRIGGILGDRIRANAEGRLLAIDEGILLGGFRSRPGSHPWIGEHAGKWLHAASLAWRQTGGAALRAKLDRMARGLMACQLPDGYLGTYVEAERWTSWDVWVHKYALIGLLAYHEATGDGDALRAACRIGDLLVATFGDGGGKRDIIAAGTHVGMAATSVLEPMVGLFRATGDDRYLAFCRYLVRSWDQPNGPEIIASLSATHSVRKTANAKAYEMMSNLVGLCELARASGEEGLLDAPRIAWDDIVAHRMYVTGGTSLGEHFQDDFVLPDAGAVSETCATVTWLQLNLQLLRLDGDARRADVLERIVWNHLLAAQRPDGLAWCYFTPLRGRKDYGTGISCCVSSGPRGVALIPTWFFTVGKDGIYANLYSDATADIDLASGTRVRIVEKTRYPADGGVRLEIAPERDEAFAIRLRIPGWVSKAPRILVCGEPFAGAAAPGTYAEIRRLWSKGDAIDLRMEIEPRLVAGDHGNAGRAVLCFGPLVLAAAVDGAGRAMWAGETAASLGVRPLGAVAKGKMWKRRGGAIEEVPVDLQLVPFADAGADGGAFEVWLPLPGRGADPSRISLFIDAKESWSREGNVTGAISDGDPSTFRVTFDARPSDEDWFAVAIDDPIPIGRIVFRHGRTFHDGGWFDASGAKPRLQGRRTPDGPWEDLAPLATYPATTATDARRLRDGQAFEVAIAPTPLCGIRVIGKPACGDNPRQAFSSCAEIEAYPR
ncbi:MAG: glycoside hydrolase family 127 protein [Planctomycetes bacterium]|nr:glycoside hydrolase family 127 protein [Planctomycetota bacterium]